MIIQQQQNLKLVMTTELRQAIELLQLSTYELYQFIHEQVQENPFIELKQKEEMNPYSNQRSSKRINQHDVDPVDFISAHEPTMYRKLLDQLTWLDLDDDEHQLVHYLILNLDENGYLNICFNDVCNRFQIGESEFKQAISILQSFEPTGIGARNLAECILLQAKEVYPEKELLVPLINDHLQQLADKQWKKISEQLNISLAEIKELFECIQSLNPKPASILGNVKIEYVTPDIIIEQDSNDSNSFNFTLNDYYVPSLYFNKQYSDEIIKTTENHNYVTNQYKKFQWLQQSIEQRRNTILKILKVIVKKQSNFLKNGFRALEPLTLKEVADEIDMHESTVSRATANKIVQTPVGTFELKNLFSTKLSTSSGQDASQTKVKSLLQELINNENKFKPLSDQKIAKTLKEENGINVSRRTIAKYRDELNIPASSRRKEIPV